MDKYTEIQKEIEYEYPELKSRGRLYVLCSDKFKDNPVYACVQGGHAVAGYMKESFEYYIDALLYDENTEKEFWQNETIVYLWYPHNLMNLCGGHGCPYILNNVCNKGVYQFVWREPDQNNEITAIAFWENDLMNIENHDPYFWENTKEDVIKNLLYTRKEIDKLKIVRIPEQFHKIKKIYRKIKQLITKIGI